MKIKMRVVLGPLLVGDVLDAVVSATNYAYVFDASANAWYLTPGQFEVIPEEKSFASITPRDIANSLHALCGQDISEIKFK